MQRRFRDITRELEFPGEGELLEFDITSLGDEIDDEDEDGMPSVRQMVDYYTRERYVAGLSIARILLMGIGSVIEPYDILWMFTEGNAFLDIEGNFPHARPLRTFR